MNGKTLLIAAVGLLTISARVLLHVSGRAGVSLSNEREHLHEAALNVAQTGVGLGIRMLGEKPDWRGHVTLMDLLGGKAMISARDTTFRGKVCTRVQCTGTMTDGGSGEYSEHATAYLVGNKVVPPVPVKRRGHR